MPSLSVEDIHLLFILCNAKHERERLLVEARQRQFVSEQFINLKLILCGAALEAVVVCVIEPIGGVVSVVLQFGELAYAVDLFSNDDTLLPAWIKDLKTKGFTAAQFIFTRKP